MDPVEQLRWIIELADAYFKSSDDCTQSEKTREEFELAAYGVRYQRGLLRAAVDEVKAGWQ